MRFLTGDADCRMTRPDCAVMCNLINIHTYPVLHVVANTVRGMLDREIKVQSNNIYKAPTRG